MIQNMVGLPISRMKISKLYTTNLAVTSFPVAGRLRVVVAGAVPVVAVVVVAADRWCLEEKASVIRWTAVDVWSNISRPGEKRTCKDQWPRRRLGVHYSYRVFCKVGLRGGLTFCKSDRASIWCGSAGARTKIATHSVYCHKNNILQAWRRGR